MFKINLTATSFEKKLFIILSGWNVITNLFILGFAEPFWIFGTNIYVLKLYRVNIRIFVTLEIRVNIYF